MRAFEMYLRSELGLANGSVRVYLSALNGYAKWCKTPQDISADIEKICEYIRYLSAKGRKADTVARIVSTFRTYLTWLGIPKSVLDRLEAPKRGQHVQFCPNESEVKAVIAAAPTLRGRAVLTLLYATGMRESELCGMTIKDVIDWQSGKLMVRGGKGAKDRIIFASGPALAVLWSYLDSRPQPLYQSWPLFASTADNQKPIKAGRVYHLVVDCGKRANLRARCTPHALRRAFATHMLRTLTRKGNDAGLAFVSRLLGHDDFATTARYLVYCRDHLRDELMLRHPRWRESQGLAPEMYPL